MKEEQRQRLVRIFREEAAQVFDELRRTLESLSESRGAELSAHFDDCMRLAHNLKGSAGSVGLDEVAARAHALEDDFVRARASGEAPAEATLAELMRAVVDLERRCDADAQAATHRGADADPGDGKGAKAEASARRDEGAGATSEATAARSVRVDAARLDRMIARAHELLSMRARLRSRTDRLVTLLEDCLDASRGSAEVRATAWEDLLDRLEDMVRSEREENLLFARFSAELGASMRQLRMLPLDDAAPAWRRAVADSAARLGKEMRLSVNVGAVEIDKEILDRLRDPVLHLLRNAADHGIEPTEERFEAGKPRRGHVSITASLEMGMVRLSISDDGRGIDVEKVARAAAARGRIAEGRASTLSSDEVVSLLFEPGFSTSSAVSTVSGRGMGLAEVGKALEDLGGRVEVAATGDAGGATFHLIFPVTTLTTRGLLVRAGSATYAVPIHSVERTVRIASEDLGAPDGGPAIVRVEGEPLRIRWLSELVAAERAPAPTTVKIVVLSTPRGHLGLVVDDVLREDEFVVRRLPWNLARVPSIAGLVPLDDGSTALVLDVLPLVERALARPGTTIGGGSTKAIRRVLVVDDSLTSRTLLENVLHDAGFDVETAVDGQAALSTLEERHFDLVISDVQMPRIDGFELTERIRRHPVLRKLPVVLVTSLSSSEDEARGLAAGANAYLVKERYENARLLSLVAELGRPRA